MSVEAHNPSSHRRTTQEFVADVVHIEDLDGALGLSFIELGGSGNLRYLALSRGRKELAAEFNEQCNACRNGIERITSAPGCVAVRFLPNAGMRQGDTDSPYGDPLEELTVHFATVMETADLGSLLAHMADGNCQFEAVSKR